MLIAPSILLKSKQVIGSQLPQKDARGEVLKSARRRMGSAGGAVNPLSLRIFKLRCSAGIVRPIWPREHAPYCAC